MKFLENMTRDDKHNLLVTLMLAIIIAALVGLAIYRWVDEQRTARFLTRIITLEATVNAERLERSAQTAETRVLVLELADEPTIIQRVEKINAEEKGRVSPMLVGLLTELRQRQAKRPPNRIRTQRNDSKR